MPGLATAAVLALPAGGVAGELFATSDNCVACHNALVTADGRDVSIGQDWGASMMANAARDPYWQAAVRREIMDHPDARAEIEDECAACHMPMARYAAKASGERGAVFAHLPFGQRLQPRTALAEDGVSCTICHQIQPDKLSTQESFTAGFVIDRTTPPGERKVFGPYEIDAGRRHVMSSAARFAPQQGAHVQDSGLCGSCHTLYTHSRDAVGEIIGTLPEQMPYLEWRHSDFYGERSCQDCHMAAETGETPIAAVLGEPRPGFSPHVFRGGNFFMLRLLNRYRDELSVAAPAAALDAAAQRTVGHLQSASARLEIERATFDDRQLQITLKIDNRAGHKLPSAYPSRRAWIELTVHDSSGRVVFASGRFEPDGSIAGNDNDDDPRRYEPHYELIDAPSEVQIYEGILADPQGEVTTGLLSAVRYIKDNRLLPRGFDKTRAPEDIAVQGRANADADFAGGGDVLRYRVEVGAAEGPFTVEAALWYQPIAYRWAHNLAPYDAFETQRLVRYYRSMASDSALVLARAQTTAARRDPQRSAAP